MAETGDSGTLMGVVIATVGAIAGGIGLHKVKKLDDLPEKMAREYVLKSDVQLIRQELRDDMRDMEAKILSAFDRVHERLDNKG